MKRKEIKPETPDIPEVEQLCRLAWHLRLGAGLIERDGGDATKSRSELAEVMKRLEGFDVPDDLALRYLRGGRPLHLDDSLQGPATS